MVFALPLVLSVIIAVIWYSSLPALWGLLVLYRMPFFHMIKNAVFLALGDILRSTFFRILALLPALLLLALALCFPKLLITGTMCVLVITVFFGLSFSRLLQSAYANFIFETYINPRIPGMPVRIGLCPNPSHRCHKSPKDY